MVERCWFGRRWSCNVRNLQITISGRTFRGSFASRTIEQFLEVSTTQHCECLARRKEINRSPSRLIIQRTGHHLLKLIVWKWLRCRRHSAEKCHGKNSACTDACELQLMNTEMKMSSCGSGSKCSNLFSQSQIWLVWVIRAWMLTDALSSYERRLAGH